MEIRAKCKDTKYYESLGYKIPRDKDSRGRPRIIPNAKIVVAVKDLPASSTALVDYKCDDCGEIHTVEYGSLKYRKNSQYLKTGETLCRTCANKRMSGEGSSCFKHGVERYSEYQNNARHRNIDFQLSAEEFKELVGQPCHYCGGYSSDWNTKSRGNGIDRKDSNVGYVYENCVPCCSKCNFIKNKIPYKDFILYIRRLYETTKNYQI